MGRSPGSRPRRLAWERSPDPRSGAGGNRRETSGEAPGLGLVFLASRRPSLGWSWRGGPAVSWVGRGVGSWGSSWEWAWSEGAVGFVLEESRGGVLGSSWRNLAAGVGFVSSPMDGPQSDAISACGY